MKCIVDLGLLFNSLYILFFSISIIHVSVVKVFRALRFRASSILLMGSNLTVARIEYLLRFLVHFGVKRTFRVLSLPGILDQVRNFPIKPIFPLIHILNMILLTIPSISLRDHVLGVVIQFGCELALRVLLLILSFLLFPLLL